MYIPKPFKVVDAQITYAFIQSNPFATLTSTIENKIVATHLPIDCLQDGKYYGHFALSNPQVNMSPDEEICIIFSGPHAYISPNMYVSDFNVPTWNYSAVHCYGNCFKKLWFVMKVKQAGSFLMRKTIKICLSLFGFLNLKSKA